MTLAGENPATTAALVAWLIAGCSQLIDAEQYGVASDAAKDAGIGRRSDLFQIKVPYLTGASCETCVAEHCATQMLACEESLLCSEWLSDLQEAPGPRAAHDRYRTATEELWQIDHGSPNVLKPRSDVITCTTGNCLDECDLGRDFSCVGEFDWNVSFPETLRTRALGLNGLPTPEQWTISACPSEDAACGNPFGSKGTDPDGFVEIDLSERPVTYEEFGGFLLWNGGDTYHEWATVISRPMQTGDYTPWGFADKATIEAGFTEFGQTVERGVGYVWVQPFDCRGLSAKGVRMHVDLATADGLVPCDECVYTYENDSGGRDARFHDFSSAGRIGFISYVPARQIVVSLHATDTGETVASEVVSVAADRFHFLRLFPASRSELSSSERE